MKKAYWLLISLILAILLVVSCTTQTSTSTNNQPATSTSTTAPALSTTTTISKPTTSQPPSPATTSAPPVTRANWWDKFGQPKYGGTMNVRLFSFPGSFDTSNFSNLASFWIEPLFYHDWTLDRSTFSFKLGWTPDTYWKGQIAESWEMQDAQTTIIHIRKGVLWQNLPPLNGREFTADDVVYHFDRLLGTGSGFTKPLAPYAQLTTGFDRVTAKDKYTVIVKFKNPSAITNLWSTLEPIIQAFEAKESVDMYTNTSDSKRAIGTGPFMLKEYVSGSSFSLVKNPNYWGNDERNPQNRLPYVDSLALLNIPDTATALAAIRTAKIDMMTDITWQDAKNLARTNPEILQSTIPSPGYTLEMRNDLAPFNDIRVRKALQMTIDIPSISKGYFEGTESAAPVGFISPDYTGFATPYEQWTQTLKDEYSFNLNKARQLMTEAGYPNGFKTNIIAPNNFDLNLLQILKAQLNEIRVDMEIRTMDFPAANAFFRSFKHDGMVYFRGGSTSAPLVTITNWTAAKNRWTLHKDPAFDAIAQNFMNSATVADAQKYAVEANLYFLQKHWVLEGFPGVSTYNLYQPYLKGYSGEAIGVSGSPFYWARLWLDKK
jgi:peptide/nickel transport system substrate-binding protein